MPSLRVQNQTSSWPMAICDVEERSINCVTVIADRYRNKEIIMMAMIENADMKYARLVSGP